MALFLLILQAVTGAFLATYYAPSPDHAYDSITHITKEVPFGDFVRGLHHWGSSAIVIVVFLHLLRIVIYDSYKSPRELTWIIGVLLLLVILSFGFTGYLLPWDQKAYWATVVGTEIASAPPIVGDAIGKILKGGEDVGAVTLTRFYAVHTIWLPWLVFALVGLHVFLVRYLGSSGPPQNSTKENQEGRQFYPNQLFEDSIAILILFITLSAITLFVPVPTEEIANPTDATYDPRPEWYFLFLFQLLKYFEGKFEIVGTFVIPTVAIALLFSLPFLDRRNRLPLRQRPFALVGISVAVVALVGLTFLGMRSPKLGSTDSVMSPTDKLDEPTSTLGEVFDFGSKGILELSHEDVFDFDLEEETVETTLVE